jgi:hypothetical protein
MKRLLERPGMVFLLVFIWKAVLLLTVAQPVPANDAFFYDGPVVHLLNHGGYFNPSIAQSRPYSGTEFFCAYPPLYQLTMLAWMSLFGTSALAAMGCHLALFGGYLLVVLAILRRLKVSARVTNLAGLFLLAITFDDRPDGLVCLLGTLGVYALTRWLAGARGWAWLAALFSVLALCASLQVGALYSFWIFLGFVAGWKISDARLPLGALAAMILIPFALAATVRFGFPRLWSGFLENVHGNASLTGLHALHLDEWFKAFRNLPAVFVMTALLLATATGRRQLREIKTWGAGEMLVAGGLVAGLSFTFACLFVVTANWLIAVNYFQPILVGLFLTAAARKFPEFLHARATTVCLALLVGLVAVRAIGLTTWGVACSLNDSYASARQRVAGELASVPPHANVLLSSAYLYEADRHPGGNWFHSDFAPRREEGENYPLALRRLHAAKLVLTQFDYYRRYQPVLEELRAAGGVQITVTNLAHVRPPDSYARLQKILQQVSWAPVIVDLDWK